MKGIVISLMLVLGLAFVPMARAEVLAAWTFENVDPNIAYTGTDYPPSGPGIPADPNVPQVYGGGAKGHHASSATVWSSPAGNGSKKSFSSEHWAVGDYYQFQTSCIGYHEINVAWHQNRSGTGPATFSLLWSVDGATWNPMMTNYTVGTATWSSTPPANPASMFGPVWTLTGGDNQPVVYFRMVCTAAPGGTGGTCRMDTVVVSGTGWACCLPNGHCAETTQDRCLQQGGIFHSGYTCGMILAVPYHWEYPVGMPLPPGYESSNQQDGEMSTPTGRVRIDLKITGVLGPLRITVEHLGTSVVLWNGICTTTSGMDTVFDDYGENVTCAMINDPNRSIKPSSAGGGYLSDFRGMEFGGPWTIRVYVGGTQTLVLVRWSLWIEFLDETYICVPVPQGACCLPDGSCIHTTQASCTQQAGTAWHYAVPCSFANCLPATGACCVGSDCRPNLTLAQCTAQGGVWKGVGTDCFPNPCVPINYYWDATTGEQGGDGYNGQWLYYPDAPDGPWYNMWWFNGLALDRQKDTTLTFTVEFPIGTGLLDVAMVRSSPTWTMTSRPPMADEEEYIEREFLGTMTTAGTYTFTRRMWFCPTWVSIDVRGTGYAVQGTIAHTCLALQTGACCVGWDCTLQTHAACAAMSGRYQGDGTTCGPPNPCAILDTVVCEPQPPNHPNTYWYDVTPGAFGRCDFHVRVYDPNPANYTGWQMIPPPATATWQHLVHQVGNEWWVSWFDPNCQNAIFGPNPTRFQFTNPNAAVWGDWRTTIGMQADPYDVWNTDNSGHHAGDLDGYGYRVHVPTFAENWYWKDCNGGELPDGFMPDFDQRQDFNTDGIEDVGYCGPTAVANSIWWYNCKFPDAGIVPANWTPIDLVQDLAVRMGTNTIGQGTWLNNMQAGIDAYLQAQGVSDLLYEHTVIDPNFDYINEEVQKSQDVTLLVGFWHIEVATFHAGNPPWWSLVYRRVGGHYLTVAGVDSLNNRVALSDPDGDFAEHGFLGVVRPAGTDHNHDGDNDANTTISFRDPNYLHGIHNTDTYASHDYYTLAKSISPGGSLALVLDGNPLTYGEEMWSHHLGENNGPHDPNMWETMDVPDSDARALWGDPNQYAPPVFCQYYAEIEAAVIVSPFEECGPQVGGLGCKPVPCPDPTQQCLPTKVRHHIPQVVFPPGGTDHLSPTSGQVIMQTPTGDTQTYTITEGPPNMTTVIRQDPIDMGGYREIETEIVQLDLVGGGGGGGGGAVYIRESPTRASTGRVVGAASTYTDYPAESFFDIYVEIDIPDLGALGLMNISPIPLSAHGIVAVPPLGATYNTPSVWSGVELYTQEGYPTGYRIVGVTHILPQPPPLWEVIECECIDPNYCHIELGDGTYCVGGCPLGYDCAHLGMTNPDGSMDLWCECQPSLGACCVGVICYPNMTEADCLGQSGVWKGAGSDCFPNPCRRIDYYWDVTTGELGGNGYNGQWIYYPYAPDGPWYNMWWPNEFALNREKEITFTFTTNFPVGSGSLDVAAVWATRYWTRTDRPPLADEETYIQRQFLATITLPGTYTYVRRLPFCPSWISIDVRGTDYIIEGTVDHICLPAVTGACCSTTGTCSVITEAACTGAGGHYYGNNTTCRPGNKCPASCRGDMNCDGQVTFADIDLFVAALAGEPAWTHWPCPWINGDCTADGNVTFADIDPFVARIGHPCP